MSVLALITVLTLTITALILFYMAFKYGQKNFFSIFEVFFTFGHVFLLSAFFVLYYSLDFIGHSYAAIIKPFFLGFVWIYFLICITIVFKTLKQIIFSIMKMQKVIK